MNPATPPPLHFRAAGVSLIIDRTAPGLPRVAHWGADLGGGVPAASDGLDDFLRAGRAQLVSSTPDTPVEVSVLPEPSAGWPGTPGLAGHRDGSHFSPLFVVRHHRTPQPRTLIVTAADADAGLDLRITTELTEEGLVRQHATVTNTMDTPYTLDALVLTLPVPAHASELLDLTGRHLRERSPQRHPFTFGTHLREGRRGRTGADATLVHAAGEAGFGWRSGEVWGVHVAWSGNHRTLAERTNSGVSLLGGGELLLPGEIILAPGESYTSPHVIGAYGHGLDELAGRFHRHLRSRSVHPASPRPVTLNTWEAVYFDQGLPRLVALADAAARVGAERYVLDDGWFRNRRDDTAGLGDWYVDEKVWPAGLHPLVDHVRGLGMQFGLWVEPEMINLDSDTARAHPDWILAPASRLPVEARHQHVLNLGNAAARTYVLERLDALIGEYRIDYLKWDHNRDLVEPARRPSGRPGVHRQTEAVYTLMETLRARHPRLEIESCSSGGARVDLGILQHTDRVWASDCIDALERQHIQRWTGLLLPPELTGTHVGAPLAHTTGRSHTLDFRAGTALFGHMGIEWDLTLASPAEESRLAQWIAAYKELRPLLHTGTVVHADHHDDALLVHGVVAQDSSRAVYAFVQLSTSTQAPAGRVRLPGLADDRRYRLSPLPPGDLCRGPAMSTLPWLDQAPLLTGRVLRIAGIQAPTLHPETLCLIAATAVP